jgi:putative flippase GtrA
MKFNPFDKLNQLINFLRKFPILKLISVDFYRFFIVGISNFFIGYTVNNVLYHLVGIQGFYRIPLTEDISLSFVYAYVIAVIAATVWGYILNKYWSFEDEGDNVASQFGKYFGVSTFNFLLNQILYGIILYEIITFEPKTLLITSVAQISSTSFQMISSYFLYKYVVFTTDTEVISEATTP